MTTRSTIATAFEQLLDPQVDLADAVDRHFGPTFRQRADGVWLDRTAFVERVAALRSLATSAEVEVHDSLFAGEVHADRHTVVVVTADATVRTEVYLFARHDPDGRFAEIQEVTLALSGADAGRR